GQVKREEIAEFATRESDPEVLCDTLISLANSRGGPDNITTVVVRVDGEGLPPADADFVADYQPTPILEEDTAELPVQTTPIRSTQPVVVPSREELIAALPPPPTPPSTRPALVPARFVLIGAGVLAVLALLYYFARS
ncbi:MAG: hypothetical protein ABR602_06555, partial [Gemmatimonadales bacterium]